ncbi:Purine catabolism regulatory protein-like family protein [Streptomyces sp. TLI_053]|uniref:helix-turn-helix domain-containing protein n=1 Tax=Streptomyces sp. TLI_053 TaxID=1855352 RepID=UPI00087DD965|nr:helix-turn-helix domain-containing protein [Streptomyces sp. TLI_053]SDT82893.1 Purine catabolism regulatory protein-like family protein [Streptomyces sp. TLI_053]
MIVGDLLALDELHIEVAWATPDLLGREVTGVTSTDLQDPARYLRPGEVVLTGLVWWRPEDTRPAPRLATALRFANALRSAEAAALLAGEGTHGTVPPELAEACRRHGVPLLSVPSGTSFRAVTDRIYLRLWGDLQAGAEGRAGLPAGVRRTLTSMLGADAPLDGLLRRAVADLGVPDCSLVTGAGRLLASSADVRPAPPHAAVARPAPSRAPVAVPAPAPAPIPVGPPGTTPFDGWLLQPHTAPGPAAATMLHGLAELLAPLAERARATATAQRQAGTRLLELLAAGADPEADHALSLAGLPPRLPLTPVAARFGPAAGTAPGTPAGFVPGTAAAPGPADPSGAWAAAALAEALHPTAAPFVAAPDGRGGAVALVALPEDAVAAALDLALPRLGAEPQPAGARTGPGRPAAGVGPTVPPTAADLRPALVQARYALDARPPGAVGRWAGTASLADLLRGIPPEVTAAFHQRLLAPLVDHDRQNTVSLVDTLDAFLRHNASWSRTAEALHVHVNTVHYRVKRIEELTGRSLLRLDDRLDLRTALLCAPAALLRAPTVAEEPRAAKGRTRKAG